jgi:hypothetical protein
MLIDFTDANALETLYLSLYFGVIIKLLWAWNVEYSFMGSISQPAHTKINHPLFCYQKKSLLNKNIILIRIVKYIRRKESSQDDTEEPISSSLFINNLNNFRRKYEKQEIFTFTTFGVNDNVPIRLFSC